MHDIEKFEQLGCCNTRARYNRNISNGECKVFFVNSFHLFSILGSSESNSMRIKAKTSTRKTITNSIKSNKGCYVYNDSSQHTTEGKNVRGRNKRMVKSKQTISSDDKRVKQNRNANKAYAYHDKKTNYTNTATTILEENDEEYDYVPDSHASTILDTTNSNRFNVKTEIDVVEHITEASILPNVTLDNQNILMNAKLR